MFYLFCFQFICKSALCDNFEDVIGLKIIDTIKYQLTEETKYQIFIFSEVSLKETNLASTFLVTIGLLK
ncbi:MAG: hypothetical protein IPP53_14060 [Bacteroidetes bacterium]|nr:hypothetical protein [Bacteroidota bacterium]